MFYFTNSNRNMSNCLSTSLNFPEKLKYRGSSSGDYFWCNDFLFMIHRTHISWDSSLQWHTTFPCWTVPWLRSRKEYSRRGKAFPGQLLNILAIFSTIVITISGFGLWQKGLLYCLFCYCSLIFYSPLLSTFFTHRPNRFYG